MYKLLLELGYDIEIKKYWNIIIVKNYEKLHRFSI